MSNKAWSILFGTVMIASAALFVVAPFVGWWLPPAVSAHAVTTERVPTTMTPRPSSPTSCGSSALATAIDKTMMSARVTISAAPETKAARATAERSDITAFAIGRPSSALPPVAISRRTASGRLQGKIAQHVIPTPIPMRFRVAQV